MAYTAMQFFQRRSQLAHRQRLPAVSEYLLALAPRLNGKGHKGQAGRIGVLGGSVDYAGAPYYAGMAALRVGAELLYLCTAEEASGPIKAYSPELMVSAVYNTERISDSICAAAEMNAMVKKMMELLPRFHALAIGPGLGRHTNVLEATSRIIDAARERGLPLVIDADGLWLITQRPGLVKGYSNAVLTPNVAEYKRLAKAVIGDDKAPLQALCEALAGPIVLQKGDVDQICAPSGALLQCALEGAPRRPGGLGDFLAGTLSVLLCWAAQRSTKTLAAGRNEPLSMDEEERLRACQAACILVRIACRAAYEKRLRAMVAPDVLEEVGGAFEFLCPARGAATSRCGMKTSE